MTRRFSSADLAAAIAAGVALWFTRASLDVFADHGRPVRLTMLPAPMELPGLVALAVLAAFLLRTALADRGRGSRRPAPAEGPPDLLLPLVSLLAIAIPYLPWVADAVPAWRVLAGPVRYALWAIVCGQALWIAIDAVAVCSAQAHARAVEGRASRFPGGWPVLLATAAACAWLAVQAPPAVVGAAAGSDAARLLLFGRILAGALASAFIWRLAERAATSRADATLVWLALCGSATFLLGGMFRTAAFPAVLCVALASGWRGGESGGRGVALGMRAAALAVLPWLHVGLLPLALVLTGGLAWRDRTSRRAVLLAVVPVAAAAAALIVARAHTWGPFLAPGPALWSAAASIADQQDGVLIHAPALVVLTVPGMWLLWRDGGAARVGAIEALGATAAVLLGVLWQATSRPSLAIPGAPLAPVLPLLALPMARWLRDDGGSRARVALARVLALWGIVATALLILARNGLVLLRGREGASAFLDWVEPFREAVRLAPMAPPAPGAPFAFAALTLIWLAVAAAVVVVVTRARSASDGGAAVVATGSVLAGAMIGAVLVDATLGSRLPVRLDPALKVESRMLAEFDARRRPLAIVYDPWRVVEPSAVPPLFSFEATPGARLHPQPVRVLLNTRLSLPAGEYELTLRPGPGAALAGAAGLQVGRVGPPMRTWQIAGAPGEPWSGRFRLPADASFVGLRSAPQLETSVQALRIAPAWIVNASDRRVLPPVVSSGIYGRAIVTFHTDAVYPERAGFWVRGRSTLVAAFTPRVESREASVRLSLHAGPTPTRVRFQTAGWSTSLVLEPGVSREVSIPSQGEPPFPVRISADAGFVPADVSGGADRRFLGCWIEVLE
jgi:hypothetical protein